MTMGQKLRRTHKCPRVTYHQVRPKLQLSPRKLYGTCPHGQSSSVPCNSELGFNKKRRTHQRDGNDLQNLPEEEYNIDTVQNPR